MARFERVAIVGIVLGAAAAVVACNDLLGLNDYVEVGCTTKCPDAGTDASDDADADAADGAGFVPESGSLEAGGDTGLPNPHYTWPQWHMPNPVEAGLVNDASYTSVGDASVVDNVTKLEWEEAATTAPTYADAEQHCRSLASHTDWRVPTRIELASLLDYMKTSAPQIDPIFSQSPAALWTASRYAGDAGLRWIVDFGTGEVKGALTATQVRCVRGGTS